MARKAGRLLLALSASTIILFIAAAEASECKVNIANFQFERRRPVDIVAAPDSAPVGLRSTSSSSGSFQISSGGGGSSASSKESDEQRLRRHVANAIARRDIAEFRSLMPSDPVKRKSAIEKSWVLYAAFTSGVLPVMRLVLEWEPGMLRELSAWNQVNYLSMAASGWERSYGLEDDYIELIRMVLDTGVRLDKTPNRVLETIISIPPSEKTARVIEWLVKSGAAMDSVGKDGSSALVAAAERGNTALVKTLLSFGKPKQAMLDEALIKAPLTPATVSLVSMLLSAGANINSDGKPFQRNFAPADEAANLVRFQREREMLLLVIRYGGDPNRMRAPTWSPLMSVMHDHELMKGLLELGANPNYRSSSGDTPLLLAVRRPDKIVRPRGGTTESVKTETALDPAGRARSVAMLLAAGADPNLPAVDGATPLMLTEGEDEGVVALLLEHGGRLNMDRVRTYSGGAAEAPFDPVIWALRDGHDALAAALLARDKTSARTNCGAYLVAAATGARRTLALLLEGKADVHARSADGFSALLAAAEHGHSEVVKLVLERRVADANERLPTFWEQSPSRIQQRLRDSASAMLAGHSGSPTGPRLGDSALMLAARNGHVQIASELLRRGADASKRNEDGMTALDIAQRAGRVEMIELLRSRAK